MGRLLMIWIQVSEGRAVKVVVLHLDELNELGGRAQGKKANASYSGVTENSKIHFS